MVSNRAKVTRRWVRTNLIIFLSDLSLLLKPARPKLLITPPKGNVGKFKLGQLWRPASEQPIPANLVDSIFLVFFGMSILNFLPSRMGSENFLILRQIHHGKKKKNQSDNDYLPRTYTIFFHSSYSPFRWVSLWLYKWRNKVLRDQVKDQRPSSQGCSFEPTEWHWNIWTNI